MVEPYHVWPWLPEGTVGNWSIRRCRLFGGGDWQTSLTCNGDEWMTDGRQEYIEHAAFVSEAYGSVLTTGIGVGFLPNLMLSTGKCTKISVIEKNQGVVDLVWPYLQSRFFGSGVELSLIQADANEYVPQEDYDFGWADHYKYFPSNEERAIINDLWSPTVKRIFFWSQV